MQRLRTIAPYIAIAALSVAVLIQTQRLDAQQELADARYREQQEINGMFTEIFESQSELNQSFLQLFEGTSATPLPDIPLDPELKQYTLDVCADYDIDPAILFALMHRESRFQVDAHCIDSNGLESVGLCQINGSTFSFLAARGIDPKGSPEANIQAACELISYYRDERGYTLLQSLAAYGAGERGMLQGKGFAGARMLLEPDVESS